MLHTATPPRREITKTALGAQQWVPWEHVEDPSKVISNLRQEGYRIVALEQTPQSVSLPEYSPPEKVYLIIGHEVSGVAQDLLAQCDESIEIPMYGKKESLNVAVATGIALHHVKNALKR